MSRLALARRALLGALALGPAAKSVQVSRPEPAELALLEWLRVTGEMNRGTPDPDAAWVKVSAAQRAIFDCPASPAKAAALLLNELAYYLSETRGQTVAAAIASGDQYIRLPFHVLASLRPSLTGRLAEIAADLLDHPTRDCAESILSRAYAGEPA